MRSEAARKTIGQERPWRLLLWAALASLLCGIVGFGEIAEDLLRMARNGLHPTKASGEIVFVGIDDKSLSEIGRWPWNRSIQAKLIENAKAAGASKIFIDLIYDSPGTPAEDAALETSLRRSKNVVLADRSEVGPRASIQNAPRPLPRFRANAQTASITVQYNYQSAVWRIPYKGVGGQQRPFSVAMAETPVPDHGELRVDYSIDPLSIPYLPASELLRNNERSRLAGKTVIIGLNADQLGDQYWIPGYGRLAGAYVHILGAETLKRGGSTDLGWLPATMLVLALCAAMLTKLRGYARAGAIGGAFALLLLSPIGLEHFRIFADITPALLVLIIVSSRLGFLRWRNRGLVNESTGIPNFSALKSSKDHESKGLVVARVHNHGDISAALSEDEMSEASRQIVARLAAGDTAELFQGDNGSFAWFVKNGNALANHLEALHAMFRSPVTVGHRQIDVALSFGVELGSSRSLSSRLASAALAADEAWTEGLRWKLHDPSRQEEVNWRVSLLGELDAAIDNGEVWLAYQPQYSLSSGRIIGAEALARWTHPTKGPISPSEFVAAAETNGRIGKLTDFALDRAISSAAAINRRGVSFQVAVNLSARLLTDRELLGRVRRMLDTHGLNPERLTLELTETATLQDAESGLATLDGLRALGIRIAIDDYGTGLSTLDYLKKVPANEIKIDQSFVKAMRVNRSDLIMVQSTIALAHSLGRTVVAEGVEDKQCLDELGRMGCDVAQGFAIGRPMGIRELVQRLQIRSAQRVA